MKVASAIFKLILLDKVTILKSDIGALTFESNQLHSITTTKSSVKLRIQFDYIYQRN